jgi:hypothetical protein
MIQLFAKKSCSACIRIPSSFDLPLARTLSSIAAAADRAAEMTQWAAAEIHDRMPVFLRGDQFALWLSGEAGTEHLKPVPNGYLQRWPVSKRVNSSKTDADDQTLIEPIESATV